MRKIILAVTILLPLLSNAQNFCGTQQTEADLVWLRDFQAHYTGGGERAGLQYVPVSIHIVGTDEGTGYMRASQALQDICDLNDQYISTGFYFYLDGPVNYINNDTYYAHNFSDGDDMMDDYNINGTVNIYFVDDPAGNCGYFSPGGNAIAIANSCGGNNNSTIAHEVGHFFSLPHTFFGWEYGIPSSSDQERVDGSNCNSAADGFCDTPPDYEADRWYCSSAPEFTDLDGIEFTPDGTLFMSYANDECANRFSTEQMDAMNANLEGPRSILLSHPSVEFTDVDSSTLISPVDGADYQFPNSTLFSWTKVENATAYVLEIGFNVSFSAIIYDVYVTDTFFLADALIPERTYYWRVKAVSEANTCEGFSDMRTLATGSEFLAVSEPANTIFDELSVYPNPALSGDELTINIAAKQIAEGVITMTDINGKIIATKSFMAAASANTIKLQLPQIAEGMYFIQISDGINSDVRKIIISE